VFDPMAWTGAGQPAETPGEVMVGGTGFEPVTPAV
jgi:hypothetical protein